MSGTEAVQPNPGSIGRPKSRTRPSDKPGNKPKLEKWRELRIKATMQELAYDQRIPATPTDIHRVMRIWLELRQLDPPLLGEDRDAEQTAIFYQQRDLIIEKYRNVSSSSKYIRHLSGECDAGYRTLAEIQIVSLEAYKLFKHGIWDARRVQPSGHYHYWRLGNRFQDYLNRVVGCEPVTMDRNARKRPQESVIREFRQVDSLDMLRYYTLLFGAAHEARWEDLYEEAFTRMFGVAPKIAVLPPFAPFGYDFASDMIGSALGDGRPSPIANWQEKLKYRIDSYRTIVDLAADTGIVPRTPGNPHGERFDQEHLLRYAEKVGPEELHLALTSFKLNGTAPKLCTRFIKWLKAFDLDAPF